MNKSIHLAALISLLSAACLAASAGAQDKMRMGLSSVSGLHSAVWKKLRIGPDQERNLDRSLDLLITKYYENTPYPSLRGVETVLGFIEKDNPKAKAADPKSFVDDSLLWEIEQSGFVKKLYER